MVGAFIDAVDWDEAIQRISSWASERQSRYVCICNVHSVVTGRLDAGFGQVLSGADMATPDGGPVAWMLRRLGFPDQSRINGPDLMWKYCEHAEKAGQLVFLYGGAQDSLDKLVAVLAVRFPGLKVAGAYSPPFRKLSDKEDEAIVEMINSSGAHVVWVSLGCPKQENWMARHRGVINAVTIGVGAAFDYHTGVIKRAPVWMQDRSLEWLHRLCSEPRRLWRRYLVTNSLFIYFAIRQVLLRK